MASLTNKRDLTLLILLALFGLILTCVVAAYRQSPVAITRLCHNQSRYDGKTITVYGTVADHQEHVSQRGHRYTTFLLTDGQAQVSVFSFGKPAVADGQQVTVKGRYSRKKTVGPWLFYHEIDTTYGTITPGKTPAMGLLQQFISR